MNTSYMVSEMLNEDLDISNDIFQEYVKELVKYINANGFDALPRDLIKGMYDHDMLDIQDNIGVSCVVDGSDAFILARVPEFDNRVCLICTDCYLKRNIHLGHSSGKLLIGMDSSYYNFVKKLKEF